MTSVPSASYFSLPLPPVHQPLSVRVARYEPRKRKNFEDSDHDDDVDGETTDAASVSEAAPATSLILSPDEARQYRVAGLSFDKEIPKGNFPHGAAKEGPQNEGNKTDLLKQLSTLSPPVYLPQAPAQQGNLRLHHLSVITTILHRCLLQGDYIRAGRAWGLILREEFAGYPIDVRTEERWGIGAEILLRRDLQMSRMTSRSETQFEGPQNTENASGLSFTRKGFEDAKQYYERLIIQHPYRKQAPDAISSLHFYPAMFGLWIYVTQEESKAAIKELQTRDDESSEELSDNEDATSDFEPRSGSGRRRRALMAEIKATELGRAQQIAARMDEILVSPPYSDSPELLELRGMVSLWIADLFVSCVPQEEEGGYRYSDGEVSPKEESSDSILARREQRLAMEKRQTELQRSREFFEKRRHRGKGVANSLEDLHIEDTPPPF